MSKRQSWLNMLATMCLLSAWLLTSCGPRAIQTTSPPIIPSEPTPTWTPIPPTPSPVPPPPPPTLTPAEIVQNLEPSVVMILSTMGLQEGEKVEWAGTGVIFDPDGFVITAAHVVDGATVIKIRVPGRREYFSAKIVGIDPCADLAVLKIVEGSPFEAAPIGQSESLRLAGQVMIMGYPYPTSPDAGISVAMGILSQRGAEVELPLQGLTYSGLLKTDALVTSGNSGGPLIALEGQERGKVVGIVQLGEMGQGFGYAIPMESIISLVEELKRGGDQGKKHWLGASLIPMSRLLNLLKLDPDLQPYIERIKRMFGDRGVLILSVTPGASPAANAGLQAGDVILTMQNISVNSLDEVCEVLKTNPLPESTIEVEIRRAGRIIRVKVK